MAHVQIFDVSYQLLARISALALFQRYSKLAESAALQSTSLTLFMGCTSISGVVLRCIDLTCLRLPLVNATGVIFLLGNDVPGFITLDF